MPVGFITGQLQSERELGGLEAREPVRLPSGFVTMLMTDVEGSTALVQRLGDRYRELINEVRIILKDGAVGRLGQVVETRADEFFAVFEAPRAALDTAVTIQRELRARSWAEDLEVQVRIGIHSGYPTLNEANYIGMAVHTAPRASVRRRMAVRSWYPVTHGPRPGERHPTACDSGVSVSTGCAGCPKRCRSSRSRRRGSLPGSRSRARPEAGRAGTPT